MPRKGEEVRWTGLKALIPVLNPASAGGGPAIFGTYTRRTYTADRAAMYHIAS